jgi:hypothetical protein
MSFFVTTLKTTSLPRFLSNVFINLLVKINFHVVYSGSITSHPLALKKAVGRLAGLADAP